ncbi:MAG TPA: DUF1538 domain-containing protein [Steroidobacteraceae bacterium]
MISAWLDQVVAVGSGVVVALTPLIVVFLVFQIFVLKLPLRQVADILKGTLIAAVGLFLFLLGVGVAFLPFGRAIGAAIASLENVWLFAGIGALLGFVTAWGEPAVRVLAGQVEEASNGSIPKSLVLYTICAGVAVWVGLGMVRISQEIPLLYFLVPGYALVIVMLWLSSKDFVSIAIDAGGVATGPLANSLLLALALGAASAVGGGDQVVNGFGLVALIALAPVMSLMLLGLLIRLKTRK